jgi:hypothetical protein
VCNKHVAASQPLRITVNARDFRATASGYTAVNVQLEGDKPVTHLGDVVGEKSEWNFTLIKWDGKWATISLAFLKND